MGEGGRGVNISGVAVRVENHVLQILEAVPEFSSTTATTRLAAATAATRLAAATTATATAATRLAAATAAAATLRHLGGLSKEQRAKSKEQRAKVNKVWKL
jgi:hypothetical protein